MDLRGWVPPEVVVVVLIIALLGGSWIAFGLWKLSQHVTIGWQ